MRGLEGGHGKPRRIVAWAAGVLLVGGTLALGGFQLAGRWASPSSAGRGDATHTTRARSPAPTATPADDILAKARAIVAPAAAPARLRIPSIGVDAAVESVGLDAQGRIGSPPVPANVGWYRSGAAPGDPGDALLDGHLDWTDGPAVFWQLGRLRVGDALSVVRADGSRVKFVVDATSVVSYNAPEDGLFTATGPPSMSLITCAGAWDQQRGTYLQRLLVHASLAPGNPIEPASADGPP